MLKNEIVVDFNRFKILEKTASKFGTDAHIIIPKKYSRMKVKIIIVKSRIISKKISLDFFNSEILERKTSKFRIGAYVIIPKEYSRMKIKL